MRSALVPKETEKEREREREKMEEAGGGQKGEIEVEK